MDLIFAETLRIVAQFDFTAVIRQRSNKNDGSFPKFVNVLQRLLCEMKVKGALVAVDVLQAQGTGYHFVNDKMRGLRNCSVLAQSLPELH